MKNLESTNRFYTTLLFLLGLCTLIGEASFAGTPPAAGVTNQTTAVQNAATSGLTDYNFEILPMADVTKMKVNESKWMLFKIKNSGSQVWPAGAGPGKVNVSYHWLDTKGSKMILENGIRTPFKKDVAPGETLSYGVQIQAPNQPGTFLLQVSLIHEGVAWFETRGKGKPANYYNVVVAN